MCMREVFVPTIGGSPVTKATGDPARIYGSPADQPETSLHNSPSHPLLISPSLSSSTPYQPAHAQRIGLDLKTLYVQSAPKPTHPRALQTERDFHIVSRTGFACSRSLVVLFKGNGISMDSLSSQLIIQSE